MNEALLLVGIAVGVLVCTVLAHRIDVPAPFVLIAAGVVASAVPGVPEIELSHDVVLLGLLPPLLYAAAQQTSLVDFNAHRRPILLLSVGLVAFTAAGVGVVVHALLPQLPWSVAFAIGAVVAPPDAIATTAIGRRIGLPRKLVTILEGESLLNDATALVTLRTALAVAAGSSVEAWEVGLDLVVAAGGGVLVGAACYLLVARLRRHVLDPVTDSAMSLVVPFAAYYAAEEVHGSGVIAVVVAGLLLGHRSQVLQSARSRIVERMNWRTIAFVLENAVFLLIGLQASWIVGEVGAAGLGVGRVVAVCAATLAAVVVLRLVWVVVIRYLLVRPGPGWEGQGAPDGALTFLLGWAGMRGVVTLAAAFVIPVGTPYREVLLLVAFTVVAGTIFLQGLSLPWLARRLAVAGPDPAEDALARATLLQQATKAATRRLDELDLEDPHDVVAVVRQRMDQRNFAAWERLGTTSGEESPSALYNRLRLALLQAERDRVLQIRSSGTVPAEVVAEVLGMLDLEESMLAAAEEEREDLRGMTESRRSGESCADLERRPAVPTAAEPVCERCVAEGLRSVALRQCLDCGRIGCCDSSPGRHATAHFRESGHPVIESAEPGEDWRWCYLHHRTA